MNLLKSHSFSKAALKRNLLFHLKKYNSNFNILKIDMDNHFEIKNKYVILNERDINNFLINDNNFFLEIEDTILNNDLENTWSVIESNFFQSLDKIKNLLDTSIIEISKKSSFEYKIFKNINLFILNHKKRIVDYIYLTLLRERNFYNEKFYFINLKTNNETLINFDKNLLNIKLKSLNKNSWKLISEDIKKSLNFDNYDILCFNCQIAMLLNPTILFISNAELIVLPFLGEYNILLIKKGRSFYWNNSLKELQIKKNSDLKGFKKSYYFGYIPIYFEDNKISKKDLWGLQDNFYYLFFTSWLNLYGLKYGDVYLLEKDEEIDSIYKNIKKFLIINKFNRDKNYKKNKNNTIFGF